MINAFNAWKNSSSSNRSATGTSGWIKVPLTTTNAAMLTMSVYCWQVNSNNLDMYKYNGTPAIGGNWAMINIPAY